MKHCNFSATGSRIVTRFTPGAVSLVNIPLLILNSSFQSLSPLSEKPKDGDDDYELSVLFSSEQMSSNGCSSIKKLQDELSIYISILTAGINVAKN